MFNSKKIIFIIFLCSFLLIFSGISFAKINLNITGELDYKDEKMEFGENKITEEDIVIISDKGMYFE
ncbi:MAG: hypothetical protein ACOCV1_05450, partial [Bacillota bacterium]